MIITNISSRISHHHHYHEQSGKQANIEQHQQQQQQQHQLKQQRLNQSNELRLKPYRMTNISNINIVGSNTNHETSTTEMVALIRPRKCSRNIIATCHQHINRPALVVDNCNNNNNNNNKRTIGRRQNRHHSLIIDGTSSGKSNRNCTSRRSSSSSSSSSKKLSLSVSVSLALSQKRKTNTSTSFALIAITLTFVAAIVLLTLTNEAHSLNCYTCSSADNPACDEPFSGKANFTDTDCEKQIGRPAKVCRKIVQYIEHKKVVIRSCGWIDERADDKNNHKPMCYKRSGTFALMMESCVCYEDNCNHSASLVPNQSVLLLLLLSSGCSLVYFYLAKQS